MEAFLVFVPKPWLVLMIASWLKWLGLAIALWALIGARRAAPPRCARCGYTLGTTPQSVCSECGADLTEKRAVRRHVRTVRWGGLWASASCIVVSLAAWPIIGFWPTSADEARARTYDRLAREVFDPARGDFATAWLSPDAYVRWTVRPIDRTQPIDPDAATTFFDSGRILTVARLACPARLRALHDAVLDPERRTAAALYAAELASFAAAPTHTSAFVDEPFPDLLFPMLRDALVADPTLLEIPIIRSRVLGRNFDPNGKPDLLLNSRPGDEERPYSEPADAFFGSMLLDRLTDSTVEGVTAELSIEGAAPRTIVPREDDGVAFDFSELQPSQNFSLRLKGTLVFTLVADRLRDADGAPRVHEFRVPIDATTTVVEHTTFP